MPDVEEIIHDAQMVVECVDASGGVEAIVYTVKERGVETVELVEEVDRTVGQSLPASWQFIGWTISGLVCTLVSSPDVGEIVCVLLIVCVTGRLVVTLVYRKAHKAQEKE